MLWALKRVIDLICEQIILFMLVIPQVCQPVNILYHFAGQAKGELNTPFHFHRFERTVIYMHEFSHLANK
jgi:hypothetical protein